MKAIIYKDIVSLKLQKKSLFFSVLLIISFPLLLRYGGNQGLYKFISTQFKMFLSVALVTLAICGQFISYSLYKDRSNKMTKLLLITSGKVQFMFSKCVIPFFLALISGFVNMAIVLFLSPSSAPLKLIINTLSIALVINVVTIIVGILLFIFIEEENLHMMVVMLSEIVIFGGIAYLCNPFTKYFLYLRIILFITLMLILITLFVLGRQVQTRESE